MNSLIFIYSGSHLLKNVLFCFLLPWYLVIQIAFQLLSFRQQYPVLIMKFCCETGWSTAMIFLWRSIVCSVPFSVVSTDQSKSVLNKLLLKWIVVTLQDLLVGVGYTLWVTSNRSFVANCSHCGSQVDCSVVIKFRFGYHKGIHLSLNGP